MAKNYENTTIKKAIEDSGGIISTIAERLGCEWHTAKKYIESSDELKSAYEAESESVIDLAESKGFLCDELKNIYHLLRSRLHEMSQQGELGFCQA